MSRSVEHDWVLDEAEALLDMDGRRERLELVVAGLQSGKVQPADHATARDRIEKRIRDRRARNHQPTRAPAARSCARSAAAMTRMSRYARSALVLAVTACPGLLVR